MKCILCNNGKTDLIDTKIRNVHTDKTKVYKCSSCGVHFLNPYFTEKELRSFYNGEYRKNYTEENYYSEEKIENFFRKSIPEAEIRVSRVEKYLNKEDVILEIGCSSGYFLNILKDKVKLVSGTEWDEGNSSYCKKLGINTAKNIEDFKYKFDKIFMFHVLEHMIDPINFLEKLKNSMKEDSILFIEVPNNGDILLSTYDIPQFRDFYYQSAHLWYFNRRSLSYVLDKAGYQYEIINIQRYDISNHINWLENRKPGGQGMFDNIFDDELKSAYDNVLIKSNKTDTIFAVCKIKK
ncbi:class I SAM-dependent methyltransferase [Clostridium malenominatum]|uniref:Class I SAM-dependent methyltransferase n=1 Tax=Clostridium malenominatum TaxID=1539 RepID=A0ABP3U4L8_9CLOT